MILRIKLKKKKDKVPPKLDLLDPLCCTMETDNDYLYIQESHHCFKWVIPLNEIKYIKILKENK